MLLKGQSFHQRLDEIKHREEAELSKQRGEDFRERKREQKRAVIEGKQKQRVARAERKLMMSFFDSPSQFKGHTARLDDAFFAGASSGAIVTYAETPMV